MRFARNALLGLELCSYTALCASSWAYYSLQRQKRLAHEDLSELDEAKRQIQAAEARAADTISLGEKANDQSRQQAVRRLAVLYELQNQMSALRYAQKQADKDAAAVANVGRRSQLVATEDQVQTLRDRIVQIASLLEESKNDSVMGQGESGAFAIRSQTALAEEGRRLTTSLIPQSPVYNIVFNPEGTNQLPSGVDVNIRFFVAQQHIRGGVPLPRWTINPDILNSRNAIPLTVTMNCIPCATNKLQEKVVTYSPNDGFSSEAIFTVRAMHDRARMSDGLSQLVFDVASDGIEYDHIVADVRVTSGAFDGEPGHVSGLPSERPGQPAAFSQESVPQRPSGEPVGSQKADIVFHFYRDSDKLRVRIQPILPELVTLFRSRYLKDGELRDFNSALLTEKTIRSADNDAYVALRQLIEPENEAIQNLLNGSPSNSPEIQLHMDFSPVERDAILAQFHKFGSGFYSRLFSDVTADADLRELMSDFDDFADTHPGLHVQIWPNDVNIPWQLLHVPSDDVGAQKFWGFRYELTVIPFRIDGGTPRPILTYSGAHSAIFAGYSDEEFTNHYIIDKGVEASQIVSQALHHPVDFPKTASEFLGKLDENRNEIQLILAFTHATSGTIDFTPRSGGPIFRQDDYGPRILFSADKWAKPNDIYELRTHHKSDPEHAEFFSAQPFVFLNACETTTLGFQAEGDRDATGTSEGFPEIMLRLGARGVIGTESRVWAPFAFYFGNELLHKILQGYEVPKALRDVRLMYYHDHGNPLGLLYSYYGNPDVQIKVPDEIADSTR